MDVLVTTTGFNELGAYFNLGGRADHEGDQSSQTNLANNFDVNSLQINFGRRPDQPLPPGFTRLSPTRGVYVDDGAFGAVASVGQRATETDDVPARFLVYVNDRLASSTGWSPLRVWMVSNDAAPATGLLPDGVQYCNCSAARFGWWGGQFGVVAGPDSERVDAFFPGTFAVGNLPDIADVPSEGTAAYAGHAAAAIRSDGAAYAAVGRLHHELELCHPGRQCGDSTTR